MQRAFSTAPPAHLLDAGLEHRLGLVELLQRRAARLLQEALGVLQEGRKRARWGERAGASSLQPAVLRDRCAESSRQPCGGQLYTFGRAPAAQLPHTVTAALLRGCCRCTAAWGACRPKPP